MTDIIHDDERFLDVGTVARRLDVVPETVRSWIRAGKLIAITTPTGRYRVPVSALKMILASRKAQDSQNSQN